MSELNKKISELDLRNSINGGEFIPFEHNSVNGKITIDLIKQYATNQIIERLTSVERNPEVISFSQIVTTIPAVTNQSANYSSDNPTVSIIFVTSLCKFVCKRNITLTSVAYYPNWLDDYKFNPLRKGVVYIDMTEMCLYAYNGYTLEKVGDDYGTEIGQLQVDLNTLSNQLQLNTDSLNDYIETVAESLGESLVDTQTELTGYINDKIAEVNQSIEAVENDLNFLLTGNVSEAIDSFNEVLDFLNGVTDNEKLTTKLAAINTSMGDEAAIRASKDLELETSISSKGIVWNDRIDIKAGSLVSYNDVLYRALNDVPSGGANPYNNNNYVRLTCSGYLMVTDEEYESIKSRNSLDENILYLIEEEE